MSVRMKKQREKQWGKKGTEGIFEVMLAVNFPKLMTDTKPQIQGAKRTLRKNIY